MATKTTAADGQLSPRQLKKLLENFDIPVDENDVVLITPPNTVPAQSQSAPQYPDPAPTFSHATAALPNATATTTTTTAPAATALASPAPAANHATNGTAKQFLKSAPVNATPPPPPVSSSPVTHTSPIDLEMHRLESEIAKCDQEIRDAAAEAKEAGNRGDFPARVHFWERESQLREEKLKLREEKLKIYEERMAAAGSTARDARASSVGAGGDARGKRVESAKVRGTQVGGGVTATDLSMDVVTEDVEEVGAVGLGPGLMLTGGPIANSSQAQRTPHNLDRELEDALKRSPKLQRDSTPTSRQPPGWGPGTKMAIAESHELSPLYKKARGGDMYAQIQMGRRYQEADGLRKIQVEAARWYRLAMEQGHWEVTWTLSFILNSTKERTIHQEASDAAAWYEKEYARDPYNPYTIARWAYVLHHGIGVRANQEQSMRLLKECVFTYQFAPAQHALGEVYISGSLGTCRATEGFKLYEYAASQGFGPGQRGMGYCLEHGIGTEIDLKKAFKMYLSSAAQGDVDSMCNVGVCYENRCGVAKDMRKAVEWYQRATELGDTDAYQNLRALKRAKANKNPSPIK